MLSIDPEELPTMVPCRRIRLQKIPLRPVQFDLLEDRYWKSAFNEQAPFLDSYLKYFRTALLEGYADVLDVHEEAKCYVKQDYLAPMIWRLIQLAAIYPDSDFAETLSYFLTREPQRTTLAKAVAHYQQEEYEKIKGDIIAICDSLSKAGDDDLVKNYQRFFSELESA